MGDLLLVAIIAGERVAICASEVESVVEIEAITPVPRGPAHLAGLAALRSRVVTVIDCRVSLELGAGEAWSREAIVVEADGHPYALLVDTVEDVLEHEGRSGRSGHPWPLVGAVRRAAPWKPRPGLCC
jgi:purine-binding chemotaxis protein CheW